MAMKTAVMTTEMKKTTRASCASEVPRSPAKAEKLAAFNPLRRVPTLVLDGGEVLIESGAVLDLSLIHI